MLPGEPFLPKSILTPHPGVVNRLFDYLKTDGDRLLAERFSSLLQRLQLRWFDHLRQWLCCPRCRSRALIRKGWRSRQLKSSRGRLSIVVLQVRCKTCGRTFRPLNERMGLSFSQRFVEELVDKAIKLALHMSYAQAAGILKELTEGSISAQGLRQKVAQRADALRLAFPQSRDTVLIDSTKVKAGPNPRGSSVYLAIEAKAGPTTAARSTLAKRLVHLHVGEAEPLKQWLLKASVKRIVHDGGSQLAAYVVHAQRCRWHLIHQLKHYLWQDGVPFGKRDAYQKRLHKILADPPKGKTRLKRFIRELEDQNLKTSAGHLRAAEAETFTDIREPGFSFCTTSPLEREMRELNRRTDNGARWSEKGVENLLKLFFHYRFKTADEPCRC